MQTTPVPSTWHPIATAPKDVYILGYDSAMKRPFVMIWNVPDACFIASPQGFGDEAPTLWMPLPALPGQTQPQFSVVEPGCISSDAMHRAEVLESLKSNGLTIGECIRALSAPDDNPYVTAGRKLVEGGNDVEIDDHTTLSEGENGAWVLAWLWVSNEEAGIIAHAELLETVLDHARTALSGTSRSIELDDETRSLREQQADWLEDLVSNFADELDGIETEVARGLPGAITWIDEFGTPVRFMPSDALNQLRLLARSGGLPDALADQAERFCIRYGNKLDAILTVIQTA